MLVLQQSDDRATGQGRIGCDLAREFGQTLDPVEDQNIGLFVDGVGLWLDPVILSLCGQQQEQLGIGKAFVEAQAVGVAAGVHRCMGAVEGGLIRHSAPLAPARAEPAAGRPQTTDSFSASRCCATMDAAGQRPLAHGRASV